MGKKILITGGAGYIGKSLAFGLRDSGFDPVLLDNFSSSQPWKDSPFPLIDGDLCAPNTWTDPLRTHGKFTCVVHLAAHALVGESCEYPQMYFRNNFLGALNLADFLSKENPEAPLLHSSTCAVYGIPDSLPLREESPKLPVSPYGESKLQVEGLFRQFHLHKKLSVLNLRYFNPVGAFGEFGECHHPETHLVPNVIASALKGNTLAVFGNDYPTADGTCYRDYIHIADLVDAHRQAVEHLMTRNASVFDAVNIGGGSGRSVLEVIKITEQIHGKPIPFEIHPRRDGDPATLYADIEKAKRTLGWSPRRNLEQAIASQYEWMKARG